MLEPPEPPEPAPAIILGASIAEEEEVLGEKGGASWWLTTSFR
jgi:hypothetical protein